MAAAVPHYLSGASCPAGGVTELPTDLTVVLSRCCSEEDGTILRLVPSGVSGSDGHPAADGQRRCVRRVAGLCVSVTEDPSC